MASLTDFMDSFRRMLAARGLWSAPRDRRAGEDAGNPSAAAAARSAAEAIPDAPDIDDPAFARRLVEVLRRHDSSAAGALHVIGIRRVRERYGKRWPQMSERAHETIRAIIDRRLGRDDLCGRIDDVSYVLVLSHLTPDLARVKCAMIAEEIARKVLGEYESSGMVQAATATVRRGGEISLESFNPTELLRNLDSTTEVGDRPAAGAPVAAANGGPAARKAGDGPEEETAEAEEGPQWESDEHQNYDPWRMIQPDHPGLAPFLGTDGAVVPESVLHVRYRPIWHPRSGQTAGNLCVLTRRGAEGQLLIGGEALPTRAETSDNADLDTLPLAGIAHYLSQSAGKTIVVLPVHFPTVAVARRRTAFLAAFNGLAESVRRHIDIELMGIQEDNPQAREAEAVAALIPLCRKVQFRVRLESTFMDRFVGLRINAVGADLSRILKPEAEVLDLMRAFARRTTHLGFETYVHGARTRSLTLAAIANGFHHIDGDEIMTLSTYPQPPVSFTIDDLYDPLLHDKRVAAGTRA